ncbi:MAG TPA: hybrid sensor histidine kinase/response regulator [Gemmatimonadaceae bacterium]|nr:hybrid sensor histidine kinase/response regulator [Gemmatimonadaceae bacterium]
MTATDRRQPDQQDGPDGRHVAPPPATTPTVLVVDDTEGNRYAVARILRGAGMEVVEAVSGAEAFACLSASVPDLVVLDINLPDVSGHDVLRAIKNAEATASVPVMHVSASFITNADRAFGLERGADAYLTHPLDPDVFLATARALLRVGRAEGERARLYEAERRARAAAEDASNAKTQLLSTLSHELRTPLNSVRGHLDLIDAGVYGALTPEQHEAIGRAQRSAVYLTALINDLLNFAQLDSGRVEYQIADVPLGGPRGVLADIEALVMTQAAAKGVTVAQIDRGGCDDEALHVRADGDKVRIILVNLVTNAIKFTESGGRVALSCSVDEATRTVMVRVADTGRGIDAANAERVFEPFVQVDRHQSPGSQHGVGLGLAISRSLARAMGGDLTLESSVGAGSTFTLALPAA